MNHRCRAGDWVDQLPTRGPKALCRRRGDGHDAIMPSSKPRTGAREPVTVCIVEDHEILRRAMAGLIADRGDRVVASVATVAAGLDAVLTLRPSMAVIDNQLPDGRGVDLCRTLSSLAPEVAVILHSGTITDDLRREALDAGAAAVVTKSIRGAALLEAIDALRLPASHPAVTGAADEPTGSTS